jgi:prepilin-type N-terminal cleavage/methylation domain-containing protein
MMKKLGFTLIELMVVIVVAGILIGVAIPSFRALYSRNSISRGEALILNTILQVKSRASSGSTSWEVIFDGTSNTVSTQPKGGPVATNENLPHGVEFTGGAGWDLTFEFFRDGTATSSTGVNTFSISDINNNMEKTFELIPQIGEVKVK